MTYKQLFEKYSKRTRAGQIARVVFAVLNIAGAAAVLRELKVDKDSVEE